MILRYSWFKLDLPIERCTTVAMSNSILIGQRINESDDIMHLELAGDYPRLDTAAPISRRIPLQAGIVSSV